LFRLDRAAESLVLAIAGTAMVSLAIG